MGDTMSDFKDYNKLIYKQKDNIIEVIRKEMMCHKDNKSKTVYLITYKMIIEKAINELLEEIDKEKKKVTNEK